MGEGSEVAVEGSVLLLDDDDVLDLVDAGVHDVHAGWPAGYLSDARGSCRVDRLDHSSELSRSQPFIVAPPMIGEGSTNDDGTGALSANVLHIPFAASAIDADSDAAEIGFIRTCVQG